MKKITIILLFFGLIFSVNAKSEDKLTIEKFKTNIIIMQENEYNVKNEYETLIIFGTVPKENYFYKKLSNNYSYWNNKKQNSFNVEYLNPNITTNNEFGFNAVEDGILIYVGNSNEKFKESENIKLEFYSVFDKKEPNVFSYVICEEDYDVKKIDFTITMASGYENKDLMFSLDGKNYEKKIPGLTYKIEDEIFLTGSYNSTLKRGEKLSFLFIDKQPFLKVNSIIHIIIILLLVFVVLFSIIILKIKNKKRK